MRRYFLRELAEVEPEEFGKLRSLVVVEQRKQFLFDLVRHGEARLGDPLTLLREKAAADAAMVGIRSSLDEPLAFEADDGHRRRLRGDEQVPCDLRTGEAGLCEQLGQDTGLGCGDPVHTHCFLDAPALQGEGALHEPHDRVVGAVHSRKLWRLQSVVSTT